MATGQLPKSGERKRIRPVKNGEFNGAWKKGTKQKTQKNTRKAVLYTFIRRRGDYTTIKRRIGVGEPSTFYDNENGKIQKFPERAEWDARESKKKKSKVSVSTDRERKGSTPRRAGSERTRVRACPKKQKKFFLCFSVQNSSKKK